MFEALVDTGSTTNLISASILGNIKSIKEIGAKTQIKTLMGGQFQVNKKCNLNFFLGKRKYHDTFNAVSQNLSPSFQVILGVPFLKNNSFCVDFFEKTLRNRDVVIPILNVMNDNIVCNLIESKVPVFSKRKSIVPAYSQSLVEVDTKFTHSFTTKDLFISPATFPALGTLLVGNSICQNNINKLLVTVINFGDQPVHINKGTKLGFVEEIYSKFANNSEQNFNFFNSEDEEIGKIDHTDLEWGIEFNLDHLEENLRHRVREFLTKNSDVFAASVMDLPGCDTVLHEIKLSDDTPVQSVPYRVPYKLREELDKQLNLLLESDIIAPSNSPYSSPVLLVKKSDDTFRLACDFRRLNRKIINDTYPLPNITETIDSLAGAQLFSSLDLLNGFFQQKIPEHQQHITTITTHRGTFFWKRSPFGLRSSPAAFQRLMNFVLGDLKNINILLYLDDICVASKTAESHFEKLNIVFERLREHNLKLKPSKCHFFKEEITFLGFKVAKGEIKPINKNVDVINKFKTPKTRKHVQSFLGCVGFYRRFISDYSKRAKTLIYLTKQNLKFNWCQKAEAEFQDLKQELINLPSLMLPDLNKQFILYTDASGYALGAVLGQLDDQGSLRPVAFASRKLNDAETRYSVTERELLALVFAINYFKCYLYNNQFLVYTDHAALTHTLKLKNTNARVGRWLCAIADFDFTVKYVKGQVNSVADFLSRFVDHEIVDLDTKLQEKGKLGNSSVTKGGGETVCMISCQGEQKSKIIDTRDISVDEYISFNAIFNGVEVNSNITEVDVLRNGGANFPVNESNINVFDMSNIDLLSEIKAAQANDKFCCKIVNKLSKELPVYPKHLKFFIENDILKCKKNTNNAKNDSREKFVLPRALVQKIFSLAHEDITACHPGLFKTLERIRQCFFWSGMYAHVRKLIKTCQSCLEYRAHKPVVLADLQRLPVACRPNQVVHMDICGPYPITPSGSKYILSIVDAFSKWCELYPLNNLTSDTIAEFLIKFICANGCPETLITDRGKNFLSDSIEKTYSKLGIKHKKSTSFHAQTNAKVEINHKTMNAALAHLVNSSHNDWDLKIPFVLLALRSAVHTSTNETPFFIHTGRDMNLPINLLSQKPKLNYNDYPSYCEQLVTNLRDVYVSVKEKLEKVAERQEGYRQRISIDKKIVPGDMVMLFTPAIKPGLSKKFFKPNTGPFRVLEKTSPVNYKIQSINNPKNLQNVHVDRLTKILQKPIFPAWPLDDQQSDNSVHPISVDNDDKFQPVYNDNLVKFANRPRPFSKKYWGNHNWFQSSNVSDQLSQTSRVHSSGMNIEPGPSNSNSNLLFKNQALGCMGGGQNRTEARGTKGKSKRKDVRKTGINHVGKDAINNSGIKNKQRKNNRRISWDQSNRQEARRQGHGYSLRSAKKSVSSSQNCSSAFTNPYQFCY